MKELTCSGGETGEKNLDSKFQRKLSRNFLGYNRFDTLEVTVVWSSNARSPQCLVAMLVSAYNSLQWINLSCAFLHFCFFRYNFFFSPPVHPIDICNTHRQQEYVLFIDSKHTDVFGLQTIRSHPFANGWLRSGTSRFMARRINRRAGYTGGLHMLPPCRPQLPQPLRTLQWSRLRS